MFGWQGGTCIDEWTMAACNLAMGATLLLAGSGAYSIDNALLRRHPGARTASGWFRWTAGSLPLPLTASTGPPPRPRRAGAGAGVQRRHLQLLSRLGPDAVSRRPGKPDDAPLLAERWPTAGRWRGALHHLPGWRQPRHPRAYHEDRAGRPQAGGRTESWDGAALSRLPAQAIHNQFDYNKFAVGPYGIVARMGARATITLPPMPGSTPGMAGRCQASSVTDVDDGRFSVKTLASRGWRSPWNEAPGDGSCRTIRQAAAV